MDALQGEGTDGITDGADWLRMQQLAKAMISLSLTMLLSMAVGVEL